jgi:ORF6N domain
MKNQLAKLSAASAGLVRVAAGTIERRIFTLNGYTVMLDSDLAQLYRVPTKAFNQAVKRNSDRFPLDFRFQLTSEDLKSLRSQFVTLKGRHSFQSGRGRHSKYAPYVFTEHGIAMLSSVLHSKRAVQMNIMIVRAFIRLREMLISHKDLALRVEKVETVSHQHDAMIGVLATEIQHIQKQPPTKRRFGFRVDQSSKIGSNSGKIGSNAGLPAPPKSR